MSNNTQKDVKYSKETSVKVSEHADIMKVISTNLNENGSKHDNMKIAIHSFIDSHSKFLVSLSGWYQ